MEDKVNTILIVDDNPRNIQVLGSTLKNYGYKTGFALNGEEALRVLDKGNYDLILLDVNMPVMDGFEACRRLRQNKKYDLIPVIFLTAEVDMDSVVTGFEVGGQDYITKPFQAEELQARVSTHIQLKNSREQLSELNNQLEQLVEKRTEQLNEANKDLKAANEELVKLDQTKFEFLQLISHEIRTPLNGIKGFTELLKMEEAFSEYILYFEGLESSVDRLEDFSLNALLFTALKLGKHEPKPQDFDLMALLEGCIEKSKMEQEEKGIEIITNLPDSYSIHFDPELMCHSFNQIVRNAIIVSPRKGSIEVNFDVTSEYVELSVSDQGKGFSSNAIEELFTPFANAAEHTDKRIGLGLAISRMICELHGAEMLVQNFEQTGAKVCIRIPN